MMSSQLGLAPPSHAFRIDAALTLLAGLVTGGFALWLFLGLDFDVMCRSINVWLDSDPGRIVGGLGSRFDAMHIRSNLHPLWSIGVTMPFIILSGLVGAQAMSAAYVAFSGAVFGAAVFVALRRLGLHRLDSFLLLALCLSTSCAWLWLGIPETFVLGGASVIIPLIWLSLPRGLHDRWSGPLQSLVSLSITITNWVSGSFAALLALGIRRAFQVGVIAFAVRGILAVLQYAVFPTSGAYFNIWAEKAAQYGESGTLWQHVQTFFLSTLAAPVPDLTVVDASLQYELNDRLSRLQLEAPTGSPAGIAALILWAGIAGRGLWAAGKGAVPLKIAQFVLGMIGFNLLFHAVYGIETFLYALHFLPLFTFVAAWSLLVPGRGQWAMRAAITAAIALGMVHNLALFETMAAWHNAIPPELVSDPEAIRSCT